MPIIKDPEGTEIFQLTKTVDLIDRNILEIGCGDGRLTWKYAHNAGSTTGIDTDSEALHTAVAARPDKLLKKASLVNANSLNLPFAQNKFDIAVLSWAL